MNTPKKGARVRVVLEGEVSGVNGDRRWFYLQGDHNVYCLAADSVVSVEVLSPPEPEWQPGDVVRDPCGLVYVRGDRHNWQCIDGRNYYDGSGRAPARPFTRLVPES